MGLHIDNERGTVPSLDPKAADLARRLLMRRAWDNPDDRTDAAEALGLAPYWGKDRDGTKVPRRVWRAGT